MYETTRDVSDIGKSTDCERRLSSQPILPQQIVDTKKTGYDIYPYHSLPSGNIFNGYDTLSEWISQHSCVLIDGCSGIFWDEVQKEITKELQAKGLTVKWLNTETYLKNRTEIDEIISPFLGSTDSLWGRKADLKLADFFELDRFYQIKQDEFFDITLVAGVGAALLKWDAPVLYLDLPKNELQYRMRAASITNLGNDRHEAAGLMYKRFYFVDWVVIKEHKNSLLERITVFGDAQWINTLNWIFEKDLVAGFDTISDSAFRVRPWFEAGAWGGQWMKENIQGLNAAEINYAWSFEMIVPENGILFESDGNLLEVSFDFLMMHRYQAILGIHAKIFQTEFPIRFDLLDTFEGGNLSIQCHPSLNYIREQFGENLTQDETYYILDCKDDSKIYLGFQENINAGEFRKELEASRDNNQEIDIDKYIQTHHASKHELFLIPNGTVHSSGANNLVLEISATPYIFTFKMYDWLRMDLNGEPRAINVEHAFNNLNFQRKGAVVKSELISKPRVISQGFDWRLIHLPTHSEHFYDVHRIEFISSIDIKTDDICHILMLVEGTSITVKTADGTSSTFHYAETFVIPAAARSYILTNNSEGMARVIKAFVKDLESDGIGNL